MYNYLDKGVLDLETIILRFQKEVEFVYSWPNCLAIITEKPVKLA